MRILVVDDEPAIRFSLVELLEEEGHDVREAEHAPMALAALDGQPADLVISDLNMPAMDGMQLLDEVRSRHPATLFVLMTAYGDERAAVRALRGGAYDYVPKPFDNEEIRAIARRAREVLALRAENQRLRDELAGEFRGLIGDSPALRATYDVIRRAGPTDVTVLVTGESGTGKELAARALHAESRGARRRSSRSTAPPCPPSWSRASCSATYAARSPARTATTRPLRGRGRGTLFLDEIGDLAVPAQAKLLRALEERSVTPARRDPADAGGRAGRRRDPPAAGPARGAGALPRGPPLPAAGRHARAAAAARAPLRHPRAGGPLPLALRRTPPAPITGVSEPPAAC
jgi:two-component system, NtrC family, response regulator HydG